MSTSALAYLVPQFPGQTHIFFWREIRELEARGVRVELFSTQPPPSGLISHRWSDEAITRTHYLHRPRARDLLGPVKRMPIGELLRETRLEGRAFARDVALSVPAAWQLADECERRGVRHVHVHSCGRAALIAAIAHRLRALDYSLTLHGPLSDYGPGQRFKWRRARFATVITQALLDDVRVALAGDLPDRLTIRAMGVDTEALRREAPYEPHRPDEPLRVFSCGRLNVVKGHQDLMAAVRLLLDEGRSVSLEIAGEDDAGGTGYRRVLEERIRELRLEPHVRLLGAVDAEEVRRRLSHAHVFVLASWHEPLGVAFMEAMSCEVPTIGTAAGGVAELIRDGVDGVLVPPKDPAAIARAIVEIARDPDRCAALGRAGRERIVTSFHAGLGAETLIQESGLTSSPLASVP